MTARVFANLTEAGQALARRLAGMDLPKPVVVLALPRGGVPVAAVVARALNAPLDLLLVRKIVAPWQPELAVAAVVDGDPPDIVVDELTSRLSGVDDAYTQREAGREMREIERRRDVYLRGRVPLPVAGATVVVVDDGIATGFTVRAAVAVLRQRTPRRVIVAAPVAPPSTVDALRDVADEVVCLATPEHFAAIGQWYADFRQTSDAEVRELLEAAGRPPAAAPAQRPEAAVREVIVPAGSVALPGTFTLPPTPLGMVLFAHGSGSSRHSPRNRAVADLLTAAGLATLRFDLLTGDEAEDRANVFDIPLLGSRLRAAAAWVREEPSVADHPLGLFGASTGAAAALWAAAELGGRVRAVVSRGGRPDLAGERLPQVGAPTLLIVGQRDEQVLALNRQAEQALTCPVRVEVVPGAGHLFEEPGALERVAELARSWFLAHLRA